MGSIPVDVNLFFVLFIFKFYFHLFLVIRFVPWPISSLTSVNTVRRGREGGREGVRE